MAIPLPFFPKATGRRHRSFTQARDLALIAFPPAGAYLGKLTEGANGSA
jgi:hypothetical protein